MRAKRNKFTRFLDNYREISLGNCLHVMTQLLDNTNALKKFYFMVNWSNLLAKRQ